VRGDPKSFKLADAVGERSRGTSANKRECIEGPHADVAKRRADSLKGLMWGERWKGTARGGKAGPKGRALDQFQMHAGTAVLRAGSTL